MRTFIMIIPVLFTILDLLFITAWKNFCISFVFYETFIIV